MDQCFGSWDLGEDVRLTNSCELPAQVRLGGPVRGCIAGSGAILICKEYIQ